MNVTDSSKSSKREEIKNGVTQGSILDPSFFLLYTNDLPKIKNKDTYMVLFADDTSISVTDSNKFGFSRNIDQTFPDINTRFKDNLLSLNFNKTQYLEFWTKNYYYYYDVNTEIKYLPLINLPKFNKGAYFSGIKYFNHIPEHIKKIYLMTINVLHLP